MATPSLLVVTNSYDERASTKALRLVTDSLRAEHGADVTVLLLRRHVSEPVRTATATFLGRPATWPGARVVDDLRRWIPAAVAERLGAGGLAHRLRGLRLRWWIRRAAPDAVLLDDGLGHRVIEHLRRKPVLIVRLNEEEPPLGSLESEVTEVADLVVAAVGIEPRRLAGHRARATPVLYEHRFRELGTMPSLARTDTRESTRTRLGLPLDAVVVSGWGGDGWLDGPDLFVRTLWALHDRHGLEAHGIWFGSQQPEEVRRLTDEAQRCGLGDRYHLAPYEGIGLAPGDATCADVVVLPTRDALLREHLLAPIVCGLTIVTFDAADLDDPAVVSAADLDIDELASLAASALKEDRVERSRAALADVDVDRWTGRLLSAVTQFRR